MFSKGSKSSEAPTLSASPPQSAAPVSMGGPRPSVPSIISADLKIVGDLHSDGDLQIDGAVEGNITSHSLTIGETAVVRGVLAAETVRIHGSVVGEVRANSVTLSRTAKVEGDIVHQSLSMEAGADLIGKLTRLEASKGSRRSAESTVAASKSNGSGVGETGIQGA